MGNVNPRCNLPMERHGEIIGRFAEGLTEDEERQIRTQFPQYLFFKNEYPDDGTGRDWDEGPVRVCTCTACKAHFAGVHTQSKLDNERVTCPYCGSSLTGKAVYRYKYNMPSLEKWVKTAVCRAGGDGSLLIEAGYAKQSFTWDTLDGDLEWMPYKRYYLSRDAIQMWERRDVYEGRDAKYIESWWVPRKAVSEPFAPNLMGYCEYYGDYIIVGLEDALPGSDFKYCGIGDFYLYYYGAELDQTAKWMIKYLAWYTVYPQMEIAVKYNLGDAVKSLITEGRKYAELINWKAATPAGLLRMSKADARVFLRNQLELTDLENWKTVAKGLSLQQYLQLRTDSGSNNNLNTIAACAAAAGVSLEKGVRYVRSLMPQCARGTVTKETIIRYWKDYLDMAGKLGYDLSDQTVAMPKDLKDRHDAAAETVRLQENQKEAKAYRKRRRQLEKKYAFRMDGLSILVPTGSAEIVREGQTLHHCVAGYAARHVSGATTILFLRKSRTPGRSFLTIELKEERGKIRIAQIHGYGNESYRSAGGKYSHPKQTPLERYSWFLDPWLDWVNSGSPRDRDGNPVLPEAETITEVKTA